MKRVKAKGVPVVATSPMAIPNLVGGAIVVCSNRQVNRKHLGICPYRRRRA